MIIGIVAWGVAGFLVLFCGAFICIRSRKGKTASPPESPPSSKNTFQQITTPSAFPIWSSSSIHSIGCRCRCRRAWYRCAVSSYRSSLQVIMFCHYLLVLIYELNKYTKMCCFLWYITPLLCTYSISTRDPSSRYFDGWVYHFLYLLYDKSEIISITLYDKTAALPNYKYVHYE
jgi:hypothetical protein